MPGAFRIAVLIQATLISAIGCSVSEEVPWGEPDCDPPEPIEADDWIMSAEQFLEMTALLDASDRSWAEFDDARRCESACLHANDRLDQVLAASDDSSDPDIELQFCSLTLTVEGDTVVEASVSCAGEVDFHGACAFGRRPLGWVEAESDLGSIEAQLDRFTVLEHASITAFLELAGQLGGLAAPAQLIERCLAAADDERRHVALLVGLGATLPTESAVPTMSSSREAIALHNAVEGCVSETWAALLAHWQATHAADECTRAAFATIAADETRHAELAWDLHRWLCAGLDPIACAQLETARLRALSELGRAAATQALAVPADVRRELGLPDPRHARALAHDFAARLATAA
jgi:hypothetical protein